LIASQRVFHRNPLLRLVYLVLFTSVPAAHRNCSRKYLLVFHKFARVVPSSETLKVEVRRGTHRSLT
jgi:hypothetical protein